MKNLLSIEELEKKEILEIFSITAQLKSSKESPLFLKHKTIAQMFFENSTRTKLSFDMAIKKLGGSSVFFSPTQSSLQKGETILDTVKNVIALDVQGVVVRHGSAGTPERLSRALPNIPVVNAGDGFRGHPTQALLDSYTLWEKKKSLEGIQVLIIGDIAHSRVARSNIKCLQKLGARITVSAPPTLLPPQVETLGVRSLTHYRPHLSEFDVVMCLRLQTERHLGFQYPSVSEFSHFWGFRKEHLSQCKKEVMIMHPGPVNIGIELDMETTQSPQSMILKQVENGVWLRMAVLSKIFSNQEVSKWMGEATS